MSRTRHHRHQKYNKYGLDFGSRYNCNKNYGGGCGPAAKHAANRERRHKDKEETMTDEDLICIIEYAINIRRNLNHLEVAILEKEETNHDLVDYVLHIDSIAQCIEEYV